MDVISHVLIGRIISFNRNLKTQIWSIFFAFLPDLGQIPFYLVLGWENARPFLFPYNSDWAGASTSHPVLTFFYFLQHSFLFAFLIILPLVLVFRLPKIAFVSYFLHLIIDIFAHTGEWAIRPFYPINYAVSGFADAWAWPWWGIAISWILLLTVIIILNDKSFNKS
jgi:hypothetical protein